MSRVYDLIRTAMLGKMRVTFTYQGQKRETCPHALGLRDGREKVLVYQYGGGSNSGLPTGGQWRCIFLDQIVDVVAHPGPWVSGYRHSQTQTCVSHVDIEIWMDETTQQPYVRRA